MCVALPVMQPKTLRDTIRRARFDIRIMKTRRRLLRALLGAPLLLVASRPAIAGLQHAIALPQSPAPPAQTPPQSVPSTPTVLYETYVAGMQHHKPYKRGLLKSVVVGSDLVLKHEPTNEFDHRAIAELGRVQIADNFFGTIGR